MVDQSEQHKLNTIRDFLLRAFSPSELDELFFYAENAELSAARYAYVAEDSKPEKVRKALAYCRRHDLVDELLTEIERSRSRQYRTTGPARGRAQGRVLVWGLAAALAIVVVVLAIALVLLLRGTDSVSEIPTPTFTHTPTETPTPTSIPTSTETPTPTPTSPPTPTKTPTPTPTSTPTPTKTPTPGPPGATDTSEPKATFTPTTTRTPSPTNTHTPTPAPSIYVDVCQSRIDEGDCTCLTWDIQNVREVYLDNYAVNKKGDQEICPTTDTTYTWRIVTLDGSELVERKTVTVIPWGSIIDHYVGTWVSDNRDPKTISYALVRLVISKNTENSATFSAYRSESSTSTVNIALGLVDAEFADGKLSAKEAYSIEPLKQWTILQTVRSASGLQAIVEECDDPWGYGTFNDCAEPVTFELE